MILSSMNLISKRLILMPINNQSTNAMQVGGSHWSLLVFDSDKQSFTHYDSFSGSGNKLHANRVANIVKPCTCIENDERTAISVFEMPCSQQENGYDCGIHVIVNAEAVCRKTSRGVEVQASEIASAVSETRKRLLNLIEKLKMKV